MSIAVVISVHDGLVMAADSASTLLVSSASGIAGVANVYDNANKIFNLYKGLPIGCIAFGAGSIGNASIGTLMKDLRAQLSDKKKTEELNFNPMNYTMEGIAGILGRFLEQECIKLQSQNPANLAMTNLGIFLGGYSSTESLSESWSVEVQNGVVKPAVRLREKDATGITWGGLGEVIQRIVMGFSPGLFEVLSEVASVGQSPASMQQVAPQLQQLLVARLQAQMVFSPMPIQDAIDLGRFLVHAAIMYSRFTPGPQGVGGPIEIAAITKHEHFKWISRKHYYDKNLNQEPSHVVVDRSNKD